MSLKTLLKNGKLVSHTGVRQADLLIDGERIAGVGSDLDARGAGIVDCTGRLIFPGGVDPHTHFDLPMFGTVSSDDHYTGHKAAAFGGTTTVLDFVPQDSGTLAESVAVWREKASKAAVDFGFHMNITRLDAAIESEIPELLGQGITTLKVFMAYNGRLRLGDGEIYRVLRIAEKHEMLVMLHAENGDVIDVRTAEALAAGYTAPIWHARTRPAWGAVDAVLRGCSLAAQAGAPLYVVHMNTTGGVDMLRYARKHGVHTMGETCLQYLSFSKEDLMRPDGAKWICSPPMRTQADQAGLWRGLREGALQVIGSDHCPFFFDGTQAILYEGREVQIPGKELGRDDFTKIPNGLPGVGDRLPVLWTLGVRAGRITPEYFVALTSTNPAKIFGLYPQKGALQAGSDADIVVWDPEKKVKYGAKIAQHRTDYNLFEDLELTGYPDKVFLRGRCIVSENRWMGERGAGKFIARRPGQVL